MRSAIVDIVRKAVADGNTYLLSIFGLLRSALRIPAVVRESSRIPIYLSSVLQRLRRLRISALLRHVSEIQLFPSQLPVAMIRGAKTERVDGTARPTYLIANGAMMLRVTTYETAGSLVVQLEGKLAGP